jgi:Short C-terminal domain
MADRSALSAVPPKTRKHAEAHLGSGENVLIALVGSSGQALLALDDRILLVKPGHMAGATFGAKVTSFPYRDISAVEVNTTWMSGVIEIIVPGYDGRKPTSYWSSDKDKDPFKISNCLPIPKKAASSWQPYLDAIRQKIAQAKSAQHHSTDSQPTPEQAQNNDLVASLERLQALRASGALSDEEFQQAKERLLGNSA